MARLQQLGAVLWLLLALNYANATTVAGTTNGPITTGDEAIDNDLQEILNAMNVVYLSLGNIKSTLMAIQAQSFIPDDMKSSLQNADSNITDLDQTLSIQMAALEQATSNPQGNMDTINDILEELRAMLETLLNILELLIAALDELLSNLNFMQQIPVRLLREHLQELVDRLQELKDKIDEYLNDHRITTETSSTSTDRSTTTSSSTTPGTDTTETTSTPTGGSTTTSSSTTPGTGTTTSSSTTSGTGTTETTLTPTGTTTSSSTTPGTGTTPPSAPTPVTGCCHGGKRYPDGCSEMIMGVLNVCEGDMWEPASTTADPMTTT